MFAIAGGHNGTMFLLGRIGNEFKLFINIDVFTVEVVFAGEYKAFMTSRPFFFLYILLLFHQFLFAPLGPHKKCFRAIAFNELLQYIDFPFASNESWSHTNDFSTRQ